jgi:hypothetical protein
MILVAHARSEPLYFALLLHLGCLVCQIGELGAYSAGGGVGQACDREQHTGGSGRSLRELPRASSYALHAGLHTMYMEHSARVRRCRPF